VDAGRASFQRTGQARHRPPYAYGPVMNAGVQLGLASQTIWSIVAAMAMSASVTPPAEWVERVMRTLL